MEASQAGEQDNGNTIEGQSGEDLEGTIDIAEQEPIGEDGEGHGTVTPSSAPPASAQSGIAPDPAGPHGDTSKPEDGDTGDNAAQGGGEQ